MRRHSFSDAKDQSCLEDRRVISAALSVRGVTYPFVCVRGRTWTSASAAGSKRRRQPSLSKSVGGSHALVEELQRLLPSTSMTFGELMAGEPILIVDDNMQNLKLTKVILAAAGYEVKTAIDAEEALRILESFMPRVILMDIQLPHMDGLELTRQLKADPTRRGIIIIALTAYAMKGDDAKAFAAGCDAYLSKPIDIDALPRVVAEHLAGRHSCRSAQIVR